MRERCSSPVEDVCHLGDFWYWWKPWWKLLFTAGAQRLQCSWPLGCRAQGSTMPCSAQGNSLNNALPDCSARSPQPKTRAKGSVQECQCECQVADTQGLRTENCYLWRQEKEHLGITFNFLSYGITIFIFMTHGQRICIYKKGSVLPKLDVAFPFLGSTVMISAK